MNFCQVPQIYFAKNELVMSVSSHVPAKVTSALLPMGDHLDKLRTRCWGRRSERVRQGANCPGKEFSINSSHVAIMQPRQFVAPHPLLSVI